MGFESKQRRGGVLAYAIIGILGTVTLFGVYLKSSVDLKASQARFRDQSHMTAESVGKDVEGQFTQIYQNLRTISLLPSVRKIARHGENLDEDGRQSIQAIYNNLASNVAVSEVYVVPADLDPDAIDPATGKSQAPTLMFDELITGARPTAGAEDEEAKPSGEPEEVEIYEYRLLVRQMGWFRAHTPHLQAASVMNLPMIGGPQVMTCDNSDYKISFKEEDRVGILLSVPFFGLDGAFKGTVTAIIRNNALQKMLPQTNFALVNPAYGYRLVSAKGGLDSASLQNAAEAKANPALIYSELLPLAAHDPSAPWRLWAGSPNSQFFTSPDYRAEQTFAWAGYGLVVLLMAFSAAAVWFGGRNAALIDRASRALDALANGDQRRELEGGDRRDAIGDLARAFAKFRVSLLEKATLESRAAQERQASEASQRAHQAQVAQAAREQEEVVQSLADGLAALAAGDMSVRLPGPFPGGYERLRTDFNAAAQQLDEVLTLVRRNSDGILQRTRQLALAYADLSQRTFEQASNVEQTGRTLVGIADAVKASARATAQASDAVLVAKGEAEQSETVIGNTVGAMDKIVESTERISQIVEVIDGIAFQTNLLALNAGVEAARAGDAGRGFAVVAAEVRALAQHSAERAKDINTVVFNSKSQVDSGREFVTATGATLRRIVMQVSELAEFVGGIAEATQEQAGRLGEVNVASNRLEVVTQENARMAEECTEAVNSLETQADELAQVVAGFELTYLDEHKAAEPARAPRSASANAAPLSAHVLIVDDNEVNRKVAASMCEMFGCTSDTAVDGESAIRAASSGRYDLILMDIMMPGMDGNEATRAIRQLHGVASRTPIVAVTANTLEASIQANQAAGITCIVEKPISPAGLLAAMQTALGGRRYAA